MNSKAGTDENTMAYRIYHYLAIAGTPKECGNIADKLELKAPSVSAYLSMLIKAEVLWKTSERPALYTVVDSSVLLSHEEVNGKVNAVSRAYHRTKRPGSKRTNANGDATSKPTGVQVLEMKIVLKEGRTFKLSRTEARELHQLLSSVI